MQFPPPNTQKVNFPSNCAYCRGEFSTFLTSKLYWPPPQKKANFPSTFGYSRGEFSTFLTPNVADIWPLTTKKLFFSQIESIKECKKAKNVLFIVVYIWYFWILNPSKRWLLYAHFDRSVHFGGDDGRFTIKVCIFPIFLYFWHFQDIFPM